MAPISLRVAELISFKKTFDGDCPTQENQNTTPFASPASSAYFAPPQRGTILLMRGNRLLKLLDYYAGSIVILLLSILPSRKSQLNSRAVRNILVIKLAALGDTLLLVPTLRSLRSDYPDASVTFLGTSINEHLVHLFPKYVDRFIRFEVTKAVRNPSYFLNFLKTLRQGRFDIAFDFEQWSMITPIICRLASARHTVGFKTHRPIRHLLYDTAVERVRDRHEAGNFLSLLRHREVNKGDLRLELPVNSELRKQVRSELLRRGLKQSQRLIIIHPGSGNHGFPKEWPVRSYESLCKKLVQDFKPFVVLTGTPAERHLTGYLQSTIPEASTIWSDGDLEKLTALLSMADLFISGNNGIMHMAAALKVHQIALDGPNDPKKWGPLSSNAVVIRSSCPGCPCLDLGFEFHRTDGFCMAQISVDEVYHAAKSILRNKKVRH